MIYRGWLVELREIAVQAEIETSSVGKYTIYGWSVWTCAARALLKAIQLRFFGVYRSRCASTVADNRCRKKISMRAKTRCRCACADVRIASC
jgi:hypothetical protein